MGQAITESACRIWGARGFRKMLRDKGLGARGKVGTGGSEARHREFRGKGCVADWIRWEGGGMKQRHREFRRKWCVADEIRWEGGGMVQKREAFTKQRRTSKRNRRKKNPPPVSSEN